MEKTIKLQKVKRLKKHGFRARRKTYGGKKVLRRRRIKKRARPSINN